MAGPPSARATVGPLKVVTQLELPQRLLLEKAKRYPCWDPQLQAPWAKANLKKPLERRSLALSLPANRVTQQELLQASSPVKANPLLEAAD